MPTGKIRQLQARPYLSVDLSFSIAGTIGWHNNDVAKLGHNVTAFDIETELYSKLDETDSSGRLRFDRRSIESTLKPSMLYTLQNEQLGISLDLSVSQQYGAYLEFFKHREEFKKSLDEVHAPETPANAKKERLRRLQEYSQNRKDQLEEAYNTDQINVVRNVTTKHNGSNTSEGSSSVKPLGMQNEKYDISSTAPAGTQSIAAHKTLPLYYEGGWKEWTEDKFIKNQKNETTTTFGQSSETTNYEYKHPAYENLMRYERTQIELQDRFIALESFLMRYKDLPDIWKNDLQTLLLATRRHQVDFSRSFLLSPITGIVTAIYKDVGESVRAGEPVLRIENNERLLLVGRINYRGMLQVSDTNNIILHCSDLFEVDQVQDIPGRIATIRGHESDNDEWNVIIECDNPDKKIPLNYHFDRDNCTIEVL